MTAADAATFAIDIIDTPEGPCPVVRRGPAAGPAVLLLQPPFEEANRCRRFLADLGRELAALGIGSLLPDLAGEGDSTAPLGEDGAARWDRAAGWLARQAAIVVAMRAGCLIEAGNVRRLHIAPVRDGSATFRDMMRAQAFADLETSGARVEPSSYARRLARGETVRLGGYPVTPALYASLAGRTPPAAAVADWTAPPIWRQAEPARALAEAKRIAAHIAGLAPQPSWRRPESCPSARTTAGAKPILVDSPSGRLAAQLHLAAGVIGVLVVPGGAQTRVGAHRMFVDLAAQLAAAGIPVLRIDRPGVGDSDGDDPGFDALGPALAAAQAAFRAAVPHVERIVGVGHCDGAASLALAHRGFAGLALLNLWTLDNDTAALAPVVRAHYRRRLLQAASWRRLLTGQIDLFGAIGSLLAARRPAPPSALAARIVEALADWPCARLLVFAGRDATAQAAIPIAASLGRCTWIDDADHSFSDPSDLHAAGAAIVDLVRQVGGGGVATEPPGLPGTSGR